MALDGRKIAETWIEFHKLPKESKGREERMWSYERLCDLTRDDPEEAWKIINLIRRLDGTDYILSNLAAGPLEDLLVAHGNKFIDRIEALARSDQQFQRLLGATWQNSMSDSVWSRIKSAAGVLVKCGSCSQNSMRLAVCQLANMLR